MPDLEREFLKKWGQLVARAWTDPEFEQRLFSAPSEVLAENGLRLPEGVECKVVAEDEHVEAEPGVFYLPFAAKPEEKELSEADLAEIAGGVDAAQFGVPTIDKYLASRLTSLNPTGLPTAMPQVGLAAGV